MLLLTPLLSRGLLFDHGHELCDAGILIPAVIEPAQLVRRRLDALEVGVPAA